MNGVSTKSAAVSHMRMGTMNISSVIRSSMWMGMPSVKAVTQAAMPTATA